ncbi:ISEfa8, transposase [Enterococcus faecium]|uniref:ISEfa8, transposase n=1 Tax=Enterococcus faecium TaxID=1352 RepID=A0ABD7LS63_ENTFC|nr:ISEfa8, transposase [Enterococcus faecium]SAM49950.1 ISEfa8, transposase [Enterococcus faecium]SAM53330.1 integrase core domain protein [Enterococcus faecium]SAM53545.1 ISEfa8, transposase [Enterococcus faecium]SAM55057.1 ISEfa8, transposase [Enterococcus faecium]
MKRRGLTSTYTIAHFKGQRTACNEAKTANVLDRTFTQEQPLEAIVTDLTYVRVGKKWHYICLILDLFNREIIGYSCGEKKDASLVKEAFGRIPYSLTDVKLFHTDRGRVRFLEVSKECFEWPFLQAAHLFYFRKNGQ